MSKDEEHNGQGPLWRRMSRSVSDSTLRHPRPNLTLPLPSVTSLMQFKVRMTLRGSHTVYFELIIQRNPFKVTPT